MLFNSTLFTTTLALSVALPVAYGVSRYKNIWNGCKQLLSPKVINKGYHDPLEIYQQFVLPTLHIQIDIQNNLRQLQETLDEKRLRNAILFATHSDHEVRRHLQFEGENVATVDIASKLLSLLTDKGIDHVATEYVEIVDSEECKTYGPKLGSLPTLSYATVVDRLAEHTQMMHPLTYDSEMRMRRDRRAYKEKERVREVEEKEADEAFEREIANRQQNRKQQEVQWMKNIENNQVARVERELWRQNLRPNYAITEKEEDSPRFFPWLYD